MVPTIELSKDVFEPEKVNLVKRWLSFFTDRSISLDGGVMLINGSEVTVDFVKISGFQTIEDGSYMMVHTEGSEHIDMPSCGMYYITKFNDIVKPTERFEKKRYPFHVYMQLASVFKCDEDTINSWADAGKIHMLT